MDEHAGLAAIGRDSTEVFETQHWSQLKQIPPPLFGPSLNGTTRGGRFASRIATDRCQNGGRADGFSLGSDAKIVSRTGRYHDEERGREMWDKVFQLAAEADR